MDNYDQIDLIREQLLAMAFKAKPSLDLNEHVEDENFEGYEEGTIEDILINLSTYLEDFAEILNDEEAKNV